MEVKKEAKETDKTKVEDCIDNVVKEYEKTKSEAEKIKEKSKPTSCPSGLAPPNAEKIAIAIFSSAPACPRWRGAP